VTAPRLPHILIENASKTIQVEKMSNKENKFYLTDVLREKLTVDETERDLVFETVEEILAAHPVASVSRLRGNFKPELT